MMSIDEAIERLKDLPIHYPDLIFYENADAIKLGIEALKLIKEHREHTTDKLTFPLPGETKA